MGFQPFELEYHQSLWEQEVDYNLTESGVHPMRLEELIGDDQGKLADLLATEINYPHVNGIPALRENIARLYDGAGVENVLVTVGAAEANNIIMQTLLEPGDEMASQTPTYKQVWGLATNAGNVVRPFHLRPDAAWALDVDDLELQVNANTKIIAVVNPNNPTGYILSEAEMDAVVAAADGSGHGSWPTRCTGVPSGFGRMRRRRSSAATTRCWLSAA